MTIDSAKAQNIWDKLKNSCYLYNEENDRYIAISRSMEEIEEWFSSGNTFQSWNDIVDYSRMKETNQNSMDSFRKIIKEIEITLGDIRKNILSMELDPGHYIVENAEVFIYPGNKKVTIIKRS